MNILNRILAVILFLAFIAAAVVSIIFLLGYTIPLPEATFSQPVTYLQNLSGWYVVAAVAAAVAFIIFVLYLIGLEFTAGRPERTLLLSSNDQGTIVVNKESVESFAEKVSRQESAQVRDVNCRVRQKREGLLIVCFPTLRPGTNMGSVNPRIQTRVKEAIQNLLGLPVLDVKIHARYEPGVRNVTQQELVATGRSGNGSSK